MQDRLHNFINNRKPKDLKKPRNAIRIPSGGASSLDADGVHENGLSNEYDGSPDPESSAHPDGHEGTNGVHSDHATHHMIHEGSSEMHRHASAG